MRSILLAIFSHRFHLARFGLTSSPLCLVVRPFVGERSRPRRRRPRFRGVVARSRQPHALRLRAVPCPRQPLLPERYPGAAVLRSHVEILLGRTRINTKETKGGWWGKE